MPQSLTALNRSIKIMIEQLRKTASRWTVALGVVLVVALFNGCQTAPKFGDVPQESGNVFHVGDRVIVKFMGNTSADVLPDHIERIHDDGTITLSLIGSVTVAGKTAGDIQKEIHDRYVPKLFPELTVTVGGDASYFYVLGDVAGPGQKEYPGQMTVVKAIAAAGGFTEFGKKTNVQLTHAGKTKTVNVEKALRDDRYDAPVYAGDRIFVKRRIF
jgi:protein involved in polysaccharide export with SLBB domain